MSKNLSYKHLNIANVKKDGEFEMKRNSWVFVVVWNIFRLKAKNKKFKSIAYDWINSDDYKQSYCWYMSKEKWTDLHSINKNGRDPITAHTRNIWDLWNSPNGKFLRKVLKQNGGKYPIPNPRNLLCLSSLFEHAKTKRVMRYVLWYPVLPADNEKKRQKLIDDINKYVPELRFFYYSKDLNFLRSHKIEFREDAVYDLEFEPTVIKQQPTVIK